MNREQAKAKIKASYPKYLPLAKRKINGKDTYICPFCGHGKGGDGLQIVPAEKGGDGTQLHCFNCGFHGDIIDLYEKQNNCSYLDAFKALCEYFHITIDAEATRTPTEPRKTEQGINTPATENAPETATESPDFTAYLNECYTHRNDPAAVEYLSFRGISKETAVAYKLGYDTLTGFLIVPTSRHYYIARNTDPEAEKRYNNPRGAKIELFNAQAIYNEESRPVFVVEGAFDALSIIEAGGLAVALNSTSNCNKLLDLMKQQTTKNTLILCLDNDKPGTDAREKLETGLKELNISHITTDIATGYKDPNEALKADRTAFFDAVTAAERRTSKPDNTSDYINLFMAGEIEKLKESSNRKTGFSNLDAEAGGVYPGLYAVGGISSVGKTTFIYQMADQMAEAGQHVLFFSMEQSRLEMVSKSIARTTAQTDINTAVSSIAIRTGTFTPAALDAADEYSQTVGGRLSVIEGNFNCTVSFIGEYTRKYIEKNGNKPVVIVDYLQVLRPEKDPETGRKSTDTKQIVDYNVTQLKRMSRALDIPVFVISSLNRSNYLTPVDFESFKESGGIEYTADVVWGLQLDVMNDPIFDKEKGVKEKREKVREAKAAIPRNIELVCLKNRYGRSYNVRFRYYPQYDLFIPCNP